MTEKFDLILEKYLKDVPTEVSLKLPTLKKVKEPMDKIKLPKLKKVSNEGATV
jgi:hypothetical protein